MSVVPSIFPLGEPVMLNSSMVPSEANMDFRNSSFFKRHSQLPTAETVRVEARAQHLAGLETDKRKTLELDGHNWTPPPVLFTSLNLFVKWGRSVRVAEGQSLYAVNQCLKGAVPVPEIYGWRSDDNEVFLYMEAIKGRILEQAWDTIEEDGRLGICRELRTIYDNLRMLTQDPANTFVGTVANTVLYDRAIGTQYLDEMGPFLSVERFHNWFTSLYKRRLLDPHSIPTEPFRHFLCDDAGIKFTQGDLHQSNIIVSSSSSPRVVAIVDWEQAGWLPAYWEDCKARYTASTRGEWATKYLAKIIDEYPNTWEPWNWYTLSVGP